jgi:hypothetical protein
VPLSPSRSERALAIPEAYTSMENPGGSFNFAVGSLSAEVAMGGADTGANLAASGLSGLPMSGEPGGNAAGAVAAGAVAAADAGWLSPADSARVTWANPLVVANAMEPVITRRADKQSMGRPFFGESILAEAFRKP